MSFPRLISSAKSAALHIYYAANSNKEMAGRKDSKSRDFEFQGSCGNLSRIMRKLLPGRSNSEESISLADMLTKLKELEMRVEKLESAQDEFGIMSFDDLSNTKGKGRKPKVNIPQQSWGLYVVSRSKRPKRGR